jgi:hypothetical protein
MGQSGIAIFFDIAAGLDRRYTCNICAMINEVPMDYFCTLDATGKRLDAAERPELSRGSVDWVAPQEYMVGSPSSIPSSHLGSEQG